MFEDFMGFRIIENPNILDKSIKFDRGFKPVRSRLKKREGKQAMHMRWVPSKACYFDVNHRTVTCHPKVADQARAELMAEREIDPLYAYLAERAERSFRVASERNAATLLSKGLL